MSIGVIFDCDGILLDSMAAWHIAEMRLAAAAGVQLGSEGMQILSALTVFEEAEYFHVQFGLGKSVQGVMDLIDDMMLDYYRSRVVPRAGAVPFVQALVRKGVRTSVVSSSPQSYLRAGLQRVGLWGLFSTVLSVDDVQVSKRDPLIFQRAMQEMGTMPSGTWGIDDSVYAVRTMNALGLYTVGMYDRDDSATFEQLFDAADITVRSFDELDISMIAIPPDSGIALS
jgi:HAD superfamily hydrolase (TIGR01509 family)